MGRTPAKIELGVRCCASINIDKCTGCPYQYLYKGVGCRTQLFRDVQDYLKEIRKRLHEADDYSEEWRKKND